MLLIKQYLLLQQILFIKNLLSYKINYLHLSRYTNELNVKSNDLLQLFSILKRQWFCRYITIAEMTAIDYPQQPNRFRLIYVFLSYLYTNRLTVSSQTQEKGVIQSSTYLFPGSGWQEREIWDLFGIFFQGNSDLRRILTDYGFFGHPLRKDFPLTGFYEILYDDRKKQIIYRPVSLAQEYRHMASLNPWAFVKKL